MLDSFFKISERGSTVGREVRGGLVTFFTMAYIVALNPLIIGLSKDADGKYWSMYLKASFQICPSKSHTYPPFRKSLAKDMGSVIKILLFKT